MVETGIFGKSMSPPPTWPVPAYRPPQHGISGPLCGSQRLVSSRRSHRLVGGVAVTVVPAQFADVGCHRREDLALVPISCMRSDMNWLR